MSGLWKASARHADGMLLMLMGKPLMLTEMPPPWGWLLGTWPPGPTRPPRDQPVGPCWRGRGVEEVVGLAERGQVVRAEVLPDHQAQEGEDGDGDGQRGEGSAEQRAGGDAEGHREHRVADGDDALDVELVGLEVLAVGAFTGLDHQVTRAETTPPQTAAASSTQPALTVSQRPRVMLCVQANWLVPVSSSGATSGAPQNTPSRHGTTTSGGQKPTARGLPRVRPYSRGCRRYGWRRTR